MEDGGIPPFIVLLAIWLGKMRRSLCQIAVLADYRINCIELSDPSARMLVKATHEVPDGTERSFTVTPLARAAKDAIGIIKVGTCRANQ